MEKTYNKIKLTIELVLEDGTNTGWIADSIYEQLNRGEDVTGWDYEIVETNVQPAEME